MPATPTPSRRSRRSQSIAPRPITTRAVSSSASSASSAMPAPSLGRPSSTSAIPTASGSAAMRHGVEVVQGDAGQRRRQVEAGEHDRRLPRRAERPPRDHEERQAEQRQSGLLDRDQQLRVGQQPVERRDRHQHQRDVLGQVAQVRLEQRRLERPTVGRVPDHLGVDLEVEAPGQERVVAGERDPGGDGEEPEPEDRRQHQRQDVEADPRRRPNGRPGGGRDGRGGSVDDVSDHQYAPRAARTADGRARASIPERPVTGPTFHDLGRSASTGSGGDAAAQPLDRPDHQLGRRRSRRRRRSAGTSAAPGGCRSRTARR